MTRSISLFPFVMMAACATYRPQPLPTADPVARFNDRRLDAPALRLALDSLGVRPPTAGWRDWELAEAAWVLRPERARLAAEVKVAEAARITAGARVQPGVNTETEYSFSGAHGESRWGLALSSVFTVELGGKRGARLARANAGVLAAIARSDEEAWQVRWRVHEAAVQLALRTRQAAAGRPVRELSDSLVDRIRRRFAEGAIAATEVARTEADRQAAEAEAATGEREVRESRAALAAAIGVPVGEFDRTALAIVPVERCGEAPRDSLLRLSLESRPELRRMLAEYQVAEAEVRLEVANSWPDLQLGPGLFFDHGVGKWTVGFGLPSLPLHGNRGPIGEAEARRAVAAARVNEAQEQILGEVEQAIAGCAAAMAESKALDDAGVRRRLQLVEAAYLRGEAGQLDLGLARLDVARADRRVTEAQGRVALAWLALERAIGLWDSRAAATAGREGK